MDPDCDVITTLNDLNNRVNKKGIRKPNVSETSEEFGSVSKTLLVNHAYRYAGLVNLQRARAERTISNPVTESEYLLDAGNCFNLAWIDISNHAGLPDTAIESTTMINSFVQSGRVLSEMGDHLLASRRLCQLGDILMRGIECGFKNCDELHFSIF